MVEVQKVVPDQVPTLADTLASAFSDDPLMAWLVPENGRSERLRRFFSTIARSNMHRGDDEIYMTADGKGAAIWDPPGKWRMPPAEMVRTMPSMLRVFGGRTVRALRLLTLIEKHHPREPHWYLAVLGSHAAFRGKGLGTAAMVHVLERCDIEGLPAYLESSNPRNIPLYRRHGFEAKGELRLTPDAPVITPMWRDPRPD